MNKIRVLIGLVVFLAVMNAATIGTLFFLNDREDGLSQEIVLDENGSTLNGWFFRHELGFRPSQMDVFRDARRSFQPRAHALVFQIDSVKNVLFIRAHQPDVEAQELDALADEFGVLHARLKKETVSFYRQLYDVCSEEQAIRLQEVFLPLFCHEPHRGQAQQWRFRGGRAVDPDSVVSPLRRL